MNLSFLCVGYLFIISHGFIYLFILFHNGFRLQQSNLFDFLQVFEDFSLLCTSFIDNLRRYCGVFIYRRHSYR